MKSMKHLCAAVALATVCAAMGAVSRAPDSNAAKALAKLKTVAQSPSYYWAWTGSWLDHWDRGGDMRNVVEENGAFKPKPLADVSLACGYQKYADGRRALIDYADLASVAGTWHSPRYYAVNRAGLTAAIRKQWAAFGGITVFTWHMDQPYCTNGFPQAAYRFKSEGANRNVVRQILDGTGDPCGRGAIDGKTHRAPFKNPREWFLASLKDVADFLNGLVDESGKKIPVVLRYPHEADGSWFWWGEDCCTAEEFRALCRMEADFLRKACGPDQILFAYTADKVWTSFGKEGDAGNTFLSRYPGDAYVDIVGIDDYSIGNGKTKEDAERNLEKAIGRLREVSAFAAQRGLVACISESGGKGRRDDFWRYLHRAATADGVKVAFVDTWNGVYGTLPETSASEEDERAFARRPQVLMEGAPGDVGFRPDGGEGRTWFRDAGYGLFIHWGPYAVPAKGEWHLNASQMDPSEYAKFADGFTGAKFDARDWAAKAKRWGVKYVVFTTRHHDGFAMWDSSVNPFNAKRLGPRRDVLAELVPALRDAGLKVGYYYSPANWSRPDYVGYRERGWAHGKPWPEADRRSFNAYYKAEFAELLGRYGAPDYVWWDGCIPGGRDGIDGESLLKQLRADYPKLIWTNRMGRPYDVRCCELEVRPPKESGALWESCMTLNDNWGYVADDRNWKKPSDVIGLLLACRANGGNLLLNVGPTADGTIPDASVKILDEVGRFVSRDGVADALAVYPDAVADRGNPTALRRVFDKAERGEAVRVAVMGGSITEGAQAGGAAHRWGEVFANGLRALFPKAGVELRNAGVGATGSAVAAFRYSQDVSPFKPDLLVLEFSVNDSDGDEARATMAGVIRHAMREGAAVVLLGMTRRDGSSAQACHLAAAREYGVPFVSYRDGVMPRIKSGKWKWEDVGADSVHPNRRGHALAGELLALFVRDELRRYSEERTARPTVPSPAVTKPFEKGTLTPFAKVALSERRGFFSYREPHWGEGLMSTNAGDRVFFSFTGSTAAFLYRQGDLPSGMGRVKVKVDGVELPERPVAYVKGRTWWHTPLCWLFREKAGRHTVEIETLPPAKPGDPVGFRLAALLVSP